jgi:CHAT domain-containing protein
VVHVATHGYLSEIPLLNGIVTYLVEDGDTASDGAAEGGIDLNTEDDGFLTMAEVMGIPLDGCALVTLSACHGAEGGIAPGEGVMGLTQGFMYAGARSVLASLTKVDDEATRELMVQFYTNWESGLGKRAALQAAKQSLAASAEHALPRYWAPFVLYGVE